MSLQISPRMQSAVASIPKADCYIEEANFGLGYIAPILTSLQAEKHGARVLEVGSGPCILISELAQRYPSMQFQGIEPMGAGFGFFDQFINKNQSGNFQLHRGGYETFSAGEKFDLIFLVNVFEHLPSWRDFLRFIQSYLADQGKCVILCPNYTFPYESHFGLPILFSASLTRKIFAQKITCFEQANNSEGLWESLNFVRWSAVNKACKSHSLRVEFRTQIIRDMIERLTSDPVFLQRQKALVPLVWLVQKLGLLRLFQTKLLRRFLPYMHLIITKP